MIKKLVCITTHRTFYFFTICKPNGYYDIKFKIASNEDTISVDDLHWSILADAYHKNRRIRSVESMLRLYNHKDTKIRIRAQCVCEGNLITVDLGERDCGLPRYDAYKNMYSIEVY